jgi:RNA-directed DNA polymerase
VAGAASAATRPHREGEEPKPMMNVREKSDSAIVVEKSSNKTGSRKVTPDTETMERRAEAKENAKQQSTRRAQNRESVKQALGRVRQAAKLRKKEQFTALFHHITTDLLWLSFFALKRDAAAGVDSVKWEDYESDLERNLADLHARIHRGAYRAQPSRRRYIPKADGRQRPLAVAALEDKIIQRATAAILNQIYEEEFLGFSYGFRPKRSQHDALDALMTGIGGTKVSWIVDADIQGFLDLDSQYPLVHAD